MRMFSQELLDKIVEEYTATMGDDPLDSDEVENAIRILQIQLDFHQGNINGYEFDELTNNLWE